ncbi:MAG: DNA-binding protein [Bacteroidetes bacterium]|nr:MAG: DNA-binding protein [Bacteroidota bacterium]
MSSNLRINKVCQHCQETFIAKTSVTQYCGDDCAKRAYKKRKRDEKIAKATSTPAEQVKSIVNRESIAHLKELEFLSIEQVCTLVGMSRTTLYRFINTNKLRTIKVGGRRIVHRKELDKLLGI